MAKKNYYVVAKGTKPGIYTTWVECQKQVIGYSGAIYKGFTTIEEAQQFMTANNLNVAVKSNKKKSIKKESKPTKSTFIKSTANVIEETKYIDPISKMCANNLVVFVDGSYDKNTKTYGSGVAVLIENGTSIETYYTAGYDKWNQWNIIGEIEASKLAIEIAIEKKMDSISIYHDLEGTAKWASGNFRAKNEYTKDYVKYIEEKSKEIDIEFIKVKGHSGNVYNNAADELAKEAVKIYKRENG